MFDVQSLAIAASAGEPVYIHLVRGLPVIGFCWLALWSPGASVVASGRIVGFSVFSLQSSDV